MGGVVSGSAIMIPKSTGQLHTITLTINNQCNLHCPHCYLKYSGTKDIIEDKTIDFIFNRESSFKHLAIVGKEPLVDKRSISICRSIILKAADKNLAISLMTNGVNLQLLGDDILPFLTFLDISLDGGRRSYYQYRGVPLKKIENNLVWLNKNGFNRVNALEILNNRTIQYIDDMMEFALSSNFLKILFSPYVPTESEGVDDVEFVTLKESLSALKCSSLFMNANNALLIMDIYHCWFEGISMEDAYAIARSEGMSHKVYFVPDDPTALGVIRVTYDGLVLASFDALHTSWYSRKGMPLKESPSLNHHYRKILNNGLIQNHRIAA